MRVLVTACPMHGHVNTVLPLALAARRAGHEVVVATGADLVGQVAERGLTVWPVGPTFAETGPPRSQMDFAVAGEQRAGDLLPMAAAWGPDLVVHEETELAGLLVAQRTRARHVSHGLGIVAAGSPELFARALDRAGRSWGVADLAGAVAGAPHVSVCPPSLRPPEYPEPTHLLRPAVGESGELPAAVGALPRTRTVHLTLGTVFRNDAALDAALAGLLDLDVNVVVTVGPLGDPRRFGELPPHVLVRRHVPHAALLPFCAGTVSQGGAGILLGSLAHGLPQLVLPQGADQFVNADAAVRAGAALALRPEVVTAPAVRDAVARLLDEPGYAAAARTLQAEITAMPGADDVLAALS